VGDEGLEATFDLRALGVQRPVELTVTGTVEPISGDLLCAAPKFPMLSMATDDR
jgi:hypothetical protein